MGQGWPTEVLPHLDPDSGYEEWLKVGAGFVDLMPGPDGALVAMPKSISWVTLDEQGYVRCRVGLGKDTTNPVYVDPKITVA